jgi:CubicO group peptidase (beta-lactamase class C family)
VKERPVQQWLSDNLGRLIEKHGVPAAAIAVLAEGQVSEAAAGILNLNTGVEATADSVFQVGSITKLWTTTLVMQLVQEGKLDLDKPVSDYLPEFALSDAQAAAVITPRHLLTHTSGFAGDAFMATSRGDDAVARFVAEVLPTLEQEVEPGAGFSYNNSGFVVLGRIVELLRDGKPFHELVREHIGTPLGLRHLATIPDEALLHRAALGHISLKKGEPIEAASMWSFVHSMGPAGSMLAMSARDLIAFGQAYLDNTLLDETSRDQLWEPQVKVPAIGAFAQHWGLGWMIFDVNAARAGDGSSARVSDDSSARDSGDRGADGGIRIYGHDGGTIGQSAYFRLVPDQRVAVALLTNGGDAPALYDELVGHVLRESAGVELPARPVPPAEALPVPTDLVLGRFEGVMESVEVTLDEAGEVWVEGKPRTEQAKALMPESDRKRVVALDANRLISAEPESGVHEVLAFLQPGDDGRARYLFAGGRLVPRRD